MSTISLVVTLKKGSAKISKEDKNDVLKTIVDGKDETSRMVRDNVEMLGQNISNLQQANNDAIVQNIKIFQESAVHNSQALTQQLLEITKQLDMRVQNISKMQEEKLEQLRQSNERHLRSMQEDNARQLDKMRETVDEKLSKTINERFEQSFKLLSQQLESVYKSLDEMQKMGAEVGNLTKVLSNVKTTGIFGEVQLGAIFDQILTKEQYETNFVTSDGREPVEFAVKLPGQGDECVYMPVDSKFPFTVYSDLQEAYEKNDFDGVKTKKDQLKNTIRGMAKDIQSKYIHPPKTTNFAVMFLPVEGLYAEVAKMGLIEELQNKFNVTIAGPTTMSALLSSLQMGFRTLAIQKKSGEVWKVLGAVRREFEKFSGIVENIQDKFEQTSKEFDKLVGVRTRQLTKQLNKVDALNLEEKNKIVGFDETMIDGEE